MKINSGKAFVIFIVLGLGIQYLTPRASFYLGGWKSIGTDERLLTIEVNQKTGEVWGLSEYLHSYKQDIQDGTLSETKIDFPPQIEPILAYQLCPANKLWIRTFDKMISYDQIMDVWETAHSELDTIGAPIDCFVHQGDIAVLGETSIMFFEDAQWKEIFLPEHEEHFWKGIHQNNHGEWILQIGPSFYQLDSLAQSWSLLKSYTVPGEEEAHSTSSLLYTTDGNYWMEVNRKSIGWIDVFGKKNTLEFLDIFTKENVAGVETVEDQFGKVWISLHDEAWVFENGELRHQNLPYTVTYVRDSAVDLERGIIYFLDWDSITYKSTDYNP